jgi:hypothetical protein
LASADGDFFHMGGSSGPMRDRSGRRAVDKAAAEPTRQRVSLGFALILRNYSACDPPTSDAVRASVPRVQAVDFL